MGVIMELILNLHQYNYQDFLNCNANILTIALESFSSGYTKTYTLNELEEIIKVIHNNNKKIYLSINQIVNEKKIYEFKKIIVDLAKLNVDGYVVSDYGIVQILKENNLLDKIIFNPVTNITNKYSAKICNNMGINHVCLANELNLKDILEVSKYTNGNIEILAHGYHQICNSKRPLLTNFFKHFKIENNSPYYFIKEESRDYAYPIMEFNDEVLIYIDKQRCILPYLKEILATKIKYLRIDTIFLSKEEINLYLDVYNKSINDIEYISSGIELIKHTNSNLSCLENISILKKEKANE